jgi:MoxR-like ATPase
MPTKSPTPLDRATPHATLPQVRTSFIGREREIEAVLSGSRSAHLVSLIGPGGCGKTRLAQAVAVKAEKEFAAGILWLELAKVTDPLFVA